MKKKIVSSLLLVSLLAPAISHAWWSGDWTQRRKITLDTSTTGVETKETVNQVMVPVRLHSGNFAFADAKEDGSDIRFVAGDDKTPLKAHIESFDAVNELAIAWVQVPKLEAGKKDGAIWVYFGNQKIAAAEESKASYDASYAAVLHFGVNEVQPKDATANGNNGTTAVTVDKAGLLGGSATYAGQVLQLAPSPSLRVVAEGALTYSAWIKPGATITNAKLIQQAAGATAVTLALDHGHLAATIAGGSKPAQFSGGDVKPDAWQHVALSVGAGKATLYLDGVAVGSADAALPAIEAGASVGEGFAGLLDEVQIASAARSADWVKVAAAGQGPDTRLIVVSNEEEAGGGGSPSYFGLLLGNLTTDAWVVIGLCGIMFIISVGVMIGKARLVMRTGRSNDSFIDSFRNSGEDLLKLAEQSAHGYENSSLHRLYEAGVRELRKRIKPGASGGNAPLTSQSINAIKASIDADLVRETHTLNAKMVLLTIAISGGPFLGLLGTVVGVMITFAAIAAAGDVNVNSIAPGIAAALLATVAGLAVAIPALFGYNYLASRIKSITADMQIFVDEFVTRVAEDYC